MTATSELLTLCSSDLLYAEGQRVLSRTQHLPSCNDTNVYVAQGLHFETLTPKEMGVRSETFGKMTIKQACSYKTGSRELDTSTLGETRRSHKV